MLSPWLQSLERTSLPGAMCLARLDILEGWRSFLSMHSWAQDGTHERRARAPVWADEDDEKVEVNIAGRDRLRKLRQTEDDASISGSSPFSPSFSQSTILSSCPAPIIFLACEGRVQHPSSC